MGIKTKPLQGRLLDTSTADIGAENTSLLRHIEMFFPLTKES